MNGKIYFASDFHFGIPDHDSSLAREKRFMEWLGMVQQDAEEIYLMGDLFDFWFEYKTAVPKGYVRLLGKLAELTEKGIRIHLFRGNHDMWAFSYLEKELHLTLHRNPEFRQFGEARFYLAHGDGLGPGDRSYKLLRRIFVNRFNQWMFRWIHPDLGIPFAFFWSRRSRHSNLQKEMADEGRNRTLIETRLLVHSEELLRKDPGLDYMVYGHYHLPYEKALGERSKMIVLGDWLTHFSYGVFDGRQFNLKNF